MEHAVPLRVDWSLLSRSAIRDFLDWVYDHAVERGGQNPERTSNKAHDHIRAVAAWAWENDTIESLPRFPKPRSPRDVSAGSETSRGRSKPANLRLPGAPSSIWLLARSP